MPRLGRHTTADETRMAIGASMCVAAPPSLAAGARAPLGPGGMRVRGGCHGAVTPPCHGRGRGASRPRPAAAADARRRASAPAVGPSPQGQRGRCQAQPPADAAGRTTACAVTGQGRGRRVGVVAVRRRGRIRRPVGPQRRGLHEFGVVDHFGLARRGHVAVGRGAKRSAWSASRMPAPQVAVVHRQRPGLASLQTPIWGETTCGRALRRRPSVICCQLSAGLTLSIRLIVPDTTGAAKLVPNSDA
jgi:hypothetical protein